MAGFGNQTWGYLNYGTLGDVTVYVTNPNDSLYGENSWSSEYWGGGGNLDVNLNSTTVESFVNVGWGSDQWGIETWGESGNVHTVTGLAMTMSEGLSGVSLNGDSNLILTGNSLTLNTATPEVFASFIAEVTGIEMAMTLSYDPEVVDALGQELVMALGSAVGDANTIAEVSVQSPVTWGNSNYGFGVYGNQPVNTLVMAMSENFSGVDPAPDAEVTGQAMAMNLAPGNTFPIEGDANTGAGDTSMNWGNATWGNSKWGNGQFIADPTYGQTMAINLNSVVVDLNQPVDVSGFPLTAALNNDDIVVIAECNVPTSGNALTSSLGTATNVLIWNEVDTGTAPVDPPGWQEVSTNAA
jgi:hypothetical protein